MENNENKEIKNITLEYEKIEKITIRQLLEKILDYLEVMNLEHEEPQTYQYLKGLQDMWNIIYETTILRDVEGKFVKFKIPLQDVMPREVRYPKLMNSWSYIVEYLKSQLDIIPLWAGGMNTNAEYEFFLKLPDHIKLPIKEGDEK